MRQSRSRLDAGVILVQFLLLVVIGVAPAMGDSLRGSWHFTEGSGASAADSSGCGNSGSISSETWRNDGKIGNALEFNGSSSCVTLTNNQSSLDSLASRGTIAMWVYPHTTSPQGVLFGRSTAGASWADQRLVLNFYDTGGKLDLTMADGTTYVRKQSATTISDNTWTHVAVTWDGSWITFYINGQPETPQAQGMTPVLTGASAHIGRSLGLPYFDGVMDEVAVYDRALDASQIGDLYGSDTLRAYWRFEENLDDASAYENDGTGTGATTWPAGAIGRALDFNGSTTCVEVANSNSLDVAAEGAIEMWIKPDGSAPTGPLFSRSTGASWEDQRLLLTFYDSGSCLRLALADGDAYSNYTGNTVISCSEWTHIAATWDGTRVRLYVNGQLDLDSAQEDTPEFITGSSLKTWIGRSQGFSTDYFDGAIDDVKIYSKALNAQEVNDQYCQGALRGYWRLDQNARDSSVYENDGAGTSATSWPEGMVNKALEFNGTSTKVTLTNNQNSLDVADRGTLEMWICPHGSTPCGTLFDRSTGANWVDERFVLNFYATNGKLDLTMANGTTYVRHLSATTISTNTWTHVAVTWDGSWITFYINGQPETPQAQGVTPVLANATALLGVGSGLPYYDGLIDEVKLYDRVLSADEIVQHETRGILKGEWRLDGDTKDFSGYANDGQETGTISWASGLDAWIGKALDFNGTSTCINVTNNLASLDEIADQGAIVMWIYPHAASPQGVLFGRSTAGASWADQRLVLNLYDTGGKLDLTMADGTTHVRKLSATTIADNTWTHVAVTWDGSWITFYINGQPETPQAQGMTPVLTGASAHIGRSLGLPYFNGVLDEVKVYSKALSSSDVALLYEDEGGAYGFGCERNAAMAPIGGGSGYGQIVTVNSADYVAYSKADLYSDLALAQPGETVFVAADMEFDVVNEDPPIVIPGGVTLAGDRGDGESEGALLYSTCANNGSFIHIYDSDVRITGIRLQGPDSNITPPSGVPAANGIIIDGPDVGNVEIDNCEMWAWSGSAIVSQTTNPDSAADVHVHHNNIHHCRRAGVGYGVCVASSQVLIEACTFDYCRHAIAATGSADCSYEARYNAFGTTTTGYDVDMHGETDWRKFQECGIWRFDEGDGPTAYDSSEFHANDGTLVGDVRWSDAGQTNHCLDFNYNGITGSPGHVSVPWDSSLDVADAGTIEMWVRPDYLGGLVAFSTGAGWLDERLVLHFYNGDQTRPVLTMSNGTQYCSYVSSTALTTGQWSHLAVTWDSQSSQTPKVRFYINGGTCGETNRNTNITPALSSVPLTLGYTPGLAPDRLRGRMDEVRIYSAALSAAEIQKHYTDGHADLAGGEILVHHNTFLNPTALSVLICGIPNTGAWIHNNCFYQDIGKGAAQLRASGKFYEYRNLYTPNRMLPR